MYTIATKGIDFSKIKKASPEFYSLIRRLLTHDIKKRIGGTDRDAEEIKAHPFFRGLDWLALERKEVTPPYQPNVEDPKDTCNIDRMFLKEKPVDTPVDSRLTDLEKSKIYFN
jgi:serine/threonine protein kinase